jgi:holo-ACP synthase CitX
MRVLDIDVITAAGPISRRDIGLEPRRCLLCAGDAKTCARERKHSPEELRERVRQLLVLFR